MIVNNGCLSLFFQQMEQEREERKKREKEAEERRKKEEEIEKLEEAAKVIFFHYFIITLFHVYQNCTVAFFPCVSVLHFSNSNSTRIVSTFSFPIKALCIFFNETLYLNFSIAHFLIQEFFKSSVSVFPSRE